MSAKFNSLISKRSRRSQAKQKNYREFVERFDVARDERKINTVNVKRSNDDDESKRLRRPMPVLISFKNRG